MNVIYKRINRLIEKERINGVEQVIVNSHVSGHIDWDQMTELQSSLADAKLKVAQKDFQRRLELSGLGRG